MRRYKELITKMLLKVAIIVSWLCLISPLLYGENAALNKVVNISSEQSEFDSCLPTSASIQAPTEPPSPTPIQGDCTYHIRVGRSQYITGLYTCKNGPDLMNSGGTLIDDGDSMWIGPGHNSVYLSGDSAGWPYL